MADGSKTEKATPKKRRDERKKGNVFLSQDAVSVATLLTSACLLIAMADGIAARLGEFIVFCVRSCARPVGTAADAWMEIGRQAGVVLVKTALPLLAVTALCAIAVTFAQTRLLVSGELLKPKFSRINPLQGVKRLFSLKSVVDAFKGILKITLLMIIIFSCLCDRFLEISTQTLIWPAATFSRAERTWCCVSCWPSPWWPRWTTSTSGGTTSVSCA